MSRTRLAGCITTSLLVAQLLDAGAALADDRRTGGAAVEMRPSIERLTCADGQTGACARGEALQVAGEALSDTRRVVFLGGRGHRDDRTAAPEAREDHQLTVTVPTRARSGPVQIVGAGGDRSAPRRLRVRARAAAAPAPAANAVAAGEFAFPIRGAHDLGQSAANNFGGGRGHQGQDMFARCGTPLVAAHAGKVTKAEFDGRAGNYVVITDASGQSYVYMHMGAPATVEQRSQVVAGQQVGEVGQTGRASGCHLHFELWTSPGWYMGGRAVDPLPELRRWKGLG
jgi:murein DD-endopeptidase MepM/ murein hydrolase activator NlpD